MNGRGKERNQLMTVDLTCSEKKNHWGRPIWPLRILEENKVQTADRFPEFTFCNNKFSMHIRCGCNLHLNQALLYTTSTKFKHCHLCVCHRKEHGGGSKESNELWCFVLMERWCIQSYVQIQEISHCVFLDKAAYIFNILLQFIVSPQLSVQCLPSSKRIQKNRFGHYLQEHVISELSKLRV